MFLLFTGDRYYPAGGWKDFRDSYTTLEEALTAAASLTCDWWHVVSMESHEIVKSGVRS